jgi:hypothetical protein
MTIIRLITPHCVQNMLHTVTTISSVHIKITEVTGIKS